MPLKSSHLASRVAVVCYGAPEWLPGLHKPAILFFQIFADEASRKLRYMMNAVYSALPITENEFRYINILPYRFNDIVECTLSVRSIKSASVFKALSYVWGNASRARLILVNEVELLPPQIWN